MANCARCGASVDLHGSYVLGYHKQSAMEWIYLCADCERALRYWIAVGLTLHLSAPVCGAVPFPTKGPASAASSS